MTEIPRRILAGRYRLVGQLGQGGMGRVWEAHDELLGRDVAVKEILPDGLTGDERTSLRERAIREARAIARISHPNVVQMYDVVVEDGEPWIVMELVRSRSLLDTLTKDGPMSPERAARVGLSVLGAVRASHEAGILHRDVKPANVLLTSDGRVVLTDFGLAILDGDSGITRTGMLLGSPSYLAPERALDQPASPAADLWSLGATLFAAVEGRPPYVKSSPMATLAALMADLPPAPTQAGALTPALEALLKKEPAERANADEAERLLREAAMARPPTVAPPTAAATPPKSPRPRRQLATYSVIAAAVVALAVVAVALIRPSSDSATQAVPIDTADTSTVTPPELPVAGIGQSQPPSTSAGSSLLPGESAASTVPGTSHPPVSLQSPAGRRSASKRPPPPFVHVTFEAESYTVNNGTTDAFPTHASGGTTVGHTAAGDWVGYANHPLTNVHSISLRCAAGGEKSPGAGAIIQIRAGSATGALLATVTVRPTADFDTFENAAATFTKASSGALFIVFAGPNPTNVDTITLSS